MVNNGCFFILENNHTGSNLQGDIKNRSCYRAMKLLEHANVVVGKVLEKKLHRIVIANEMQFHFMPDKRTIDATFI